MKDRVLIVDDDRAVIGDLEYFLSREGFFVSGISKSSNAYEVLSKPIPADYIVLDIMMRKPIEIGDMGVGQETGEYLYGKLRENNKSLPVIILSAKDRADIDIDFSQPNVFFVKKPYSDRAKEVIAAIRRGISEGN